MKNIELSRMGLTPISQDEITGINGGGLWTFYEKIGYAIGVFAGTSIKIAKDIAQKVLEKKLVG